MITWKGGNRNYLPIILFLNESPNIFTPLLDTILSLQVTVQGNVPSSCEGKKCWNGRCHEMTHQKQSLEIFCLGLNSTSAPISFMTLGQLPNLPKFQFHHLRNGDETMIHDIESLRGFTIYYPSRACQLSA